MMKNGVTISVLAACAGQRRGGGNAETLITDVPRRSPLAGMPALVLQAGTGMPDRPWLVLEHNYRADVAVGFSGAARDVTRLADGITAGTVTRSVAAATDSAVGQWTDLPGAPSGGGV